ncbi:MAG TPA: acetolactate synthase [Verrucomicrobiae bacterium]|nr:acetolactate synthase [Verrucomicrobiae bacterium]
MTSAIKGRTPDYAKQFSIFTANQLGRLREVIGVLDANSVHVLAVMVLDTTDSAIIRMITDDPDRTRELLIKHGFPYGECDMLVVELDSATDLNRLMSALLEAELNINYLYSFIPHPGGKSLMALNMEDNDIATKVLMRHQFRVLRQSDISR